MDNPKVILKETKTYGKGLFAKKPIKMGEIIAELDGRIYKAEKCSLLLKDIADHAVQFSQKKWRDSKGFARYINLSCNPNCGIKGKFKIMAIRNIKKGEELTFDYEMSEDSDWRMKCRCNKKNCRKIIGAFKNLPESIRKKYKNYISEWLIKKYHL